MKALILNSGCGSRMGRFTEEKPKCMIPLSVDDTIISRQLRLLDRIGIGQVVMTTGPFERELKTHCSSIWQGKQIVYVNNPRYRETNYIYSIYLAREYLKDDILLLHGDLVFSEEVLKKLAGTETSCMVVSSLRPLPEKDFKAVLKVRDGTTYIDKVGIEFFDNAVSAQPLYKLYQADWEKWMEQIIKYSERGITHCYAETAFNEISLSCHIKPLDIGTGFCGEVDTEEDYYSILEELEVANE